MRTEFARPNPACTLCGLHKTAREVCVGADGSASPGILFVGQNPGSEENRDGRPFVGPSGRLLRRKLESVPDSIPVAFTNAVKCYTPGNREPTPGEADACRPYLAAEIAALRPLVIVALGNVALKALTGTSGVTANRGRPMPLRAPLRKAIGEEAPDVLAAWHPAYVIREPTRERDLEEDIAGAVRFVRALRGEEQGESVGWSESAPGTPITPNVAAPVWAYDIESTGVNYRDSESFRIHMLGVDDGEMTVVARDPATIAALRDWLALRERRGLVNTGHNTIGFDAPALSKIPSMLDHSLANTDDTQLLDYLSDESATSHSLQASVIRNLQIPPWKDTVTWKWETFDANGPDWQACATYNARDVRYSHRLYTTLAQRLDSEQMRLYEQLLKPAARMFERMYCAGVYISQENVAAASADVTARLVVAKALLDQRAIEAGIDPFNPRSHGKVAELLYDGLKLPVVSWTAGGARSTDAETLQALRLARTTPPAVLPVLDALLDFRETDALFSRYLNTVPKFLEADGRAHPSYSLTKTMTGRTACYGFGIQRWPRDTALRRCIAAPPGRTLVICDLSQVELRSMAFLSREPNMMGLYRDGGDMHNTMAERIVRLRDRIPDDQPATFTKDDRSIGKPISFGSLYGAEPPTLQAYALKVYGIRLSVEQCDVLRNDVFFGTFPGLFKYYDSILAEMRRTSAVRSPLGRRRRLENIHAGDQKLRAAALREGINTPNQGFSSDIALLGMLAAESIHEAQAVAFIHDAGIWECDEVDAESVAEQVRVAFEQGAPTLLRERFGVEFDVPLKADVVITPAW